MQSSRVRLACCAPNRFTPSTALWQHFIAPIQWLGQQQRFLSSVAASPITNADKAHTKEKNHAAKKFGFRKVAIDGGQRRTIPHEMLLETRKAQLTKPRQLLSATQTAFRAAEDYEGVVVAPMVSAAPVGEEDLPWCLPEEQRDMPYMDRLAAEIETLAEYARPNRLDKIARRHLMTRVNEAVTKRISRVKLEVFGSQRTGIALALSDVDFRLLSSSKREDPALAKMPPSPPQRKKGQVLLARLYNTLKKHETFKLVFLRHARYPLISLQDSESGLEAQIVLSNDTSESRSIMQSYMEKYPYLQSLFTVVKTTFDIRGLSDVFYGGFGSYTLFMMIVASIKHNPHPRNDAAGSLLNFLDFWGNFDTTKYVVSIEPVALLDKATVSVMTDTARSNIETGKVKPLPPYMMCLRDPADETNDVGRRAVAIKHVQTTFRHLREQMETDSKTNNDRPSLLAPLVGPVHELNHERRQLLQQNGQYALAVAQVKLAKLAKQVRAEDAPGAETTPSSAAESLQDIIGEEDPAVLPEAKSNSPPTTTTTTTTTTTMSKTQDDKIDVATP